jgi:gliding motility associated protien GldN
MRIVVHILALSSSIFNLYSQGSVGPSNVIIPNGNPSAGVIDGVYEKKDVLAKKRAIPYEFVRENDYVWGKRTWSSIDLREKINHPLYYPLEKVDQKKQGNSPELVLELSSQGRYSLYYIIANALKKGLIMGYYNKIETNLSKNILTPKVGGDAFIYPATRTPGVSAMNDAAYQSDIGEMIGTLRISEDKSEKILNTKDANGQAQKAYYLLGQSPAFKLYRNGDSLSYTLDPKTETTDPSKAEIIPGTTDPYPVEFKVFDQEYYDPSLVVAYHLKEDWFFDKERSVLDVRTIGLAPVIKVHPDSTEKIAFWVYFPQLRDVLKNYYVYDAKSTVGGNTFDHLFMTRRFNAVVFKESTLYDRKIEDYRFGTDALYESEKVKNTIRTFEHDVWNF